MRNLVIFACCLTLMFFLSLSCLAKEKRCAKCCPTSTSYTGYLTDNWKINFAHKLGLKEYKMKITKRITDGNFYYNLENISERFPILKDANGIVQYGLAHFTLVHYLEQDKIYLSYDCQARIEFDFNKSWKGDCAIIDFGKYDIEFQIVPITLVRE